MILNLQSNPMGKRVGFTLIETLVVLAIMGILAALLIPTAMHTAENRKLMRVRSDLTLLETTIDSYYHRLGHYPPDNPTDPAVPPLFYELRGVELDLTNNNYSMDGFPDVLPKSEVPFWFDRPGFVNSDPEGAENFFKGTLRTNQFGDVISGNKSAKLLLVSVSGKPYKATNGVDLPFNTWRYVTTKPIHNPGRYDLWAEIVVGNKTVIIGNWKQEK